jgi:hypothetical protein
MSQGTLTLFEGMQDDPKRLDKRQFPVELLGYPSSLTAKSLVAKEQNKTDKSQLLYPSEVYENLYADPSQKNAVP